MITTHLDVGCGSGYLVKAMRKNNISSYGTEIGFMFRNGLFPEVAPFVYEKSIFELDQLSSTYDLVSAMEVLEHLFAENYARNDLNM